MVPAEDMAHFFGPLFCRDWRWIKRFTGHILKEDRALPGSRATENGGTQSDTPSIAHHLQMRHQTVEHALHIVIQIRPFNRSPLESHLLQYRTITHKKSSLLWQRYPTWLEQIPILWFMIYYDILWHIMIYYDILWYIMIYWKIGQPPPNGNVQREHMGNHWEHLKPLLQVEAKQLEMLQTLSSFNKSLKSTTIVRAQEMNRDGGLVDHHVLKKWESDENSRGISWTYMFRPTCTVEVSSSRCTSGLLGERIQPYVRSCTHPHPHTHRHHWES